MPAKAATFPEVDILTWGTAAAMRQTVTHTPDSVITGRQSR